MRRPEDVTILVDLDGVAADFERQRYELLLARGLPALPPAEVIDFYGGASYGKFGKKAVKDIRDILTEPGFFLNMEPMEGAVDALNELRARGFDVLICSKPLDEHPNCTQEKKGWVERVLGEWWRKRAIIIGEKARVRADFLIDDRPDLRDYSIGRGEPVPMWKHVLFRQPWNHASTTHDHEMRDWSDLAWLDKHMETD